MNIQTLLTQAMQTAIESSGWMESSAALAGGFIAPSKPKFGDYQSSIALQLASEIKQSPMVIAQTLISNLNVDGVATVTVAAPGFINFTLTPEFVVQQLLLDQETPALSQKVVVDYFGPNLAKELHVGHLKSLLIGGAIANLFEAQGYTVTQLNHYGDFGLPIAMVIAYLFTADNILGFSKLYPAAKQLYASDSLFQAQVKQVLADLQVVQIDYPWLHASIGYIESMLSLLEANAALQPDPESAYAAVLPAIAEDLKQQGILVTDDGAQVIFIDGIDAPLIFQKSDGTYTYAATDLAAIKQRLEAGNTILVYVTGAEQSLHFQQVFAAAKLIGWTTPDTQLIHIPLGLVLSPDGKKLQSRTGTATSLESLIEQVISSVGSEDLAIATLKYNQVSQNPLTTSVFSVDQLMATKGNTAVYQGYTLARIDGLLTHAIVAPTLECGIAPEFLPLAKKLLKAEEVLQSSTLAPHLLTQYLFELSQSFNELYESHSAISSNPSALFLSQKLAQVLSNGLLLIGINPSVLKNSL